MNNETGMKPIAFGVFLIIAIYSISLIMDYRETTDSELDEPIRLVNSDEEAAQLRDEVDSLYNEAMEDAYINESDSEKVKRVGQIVATGMDGEMLELGLIDSNYKYKDLSSVRRYFELVTANHQRILPDTSDGVTSKESELTPYMHTYTYVIEDFLTPEHAEAIREQAQTQESIQEKCYGMYSSKYQKANNTGVTMMIYDLSGELISKVILDKSTCH